MKAPILLIHGFLGNPGEFDALKTVLEADGNRVECLTLAGHGLKNTRPLTDFSTEMILQEAMDEFEQFDFETPPILIGHSLGGVMALLLAEEFNVRAVCTIGAPFNASYIASPWRYANIPLPKLIRSIPFIKDYRHGGIRPQFQYWQLPWIRQQGLDLMAQMQANLKQINGPLWIIHSLYDLSVPYEQSYLLEKRATEQGLAVTHTRLEHCGHQIFPNSPMTDQVTKAIQAWLQNV